MLIKQIKYFSKYSFSFLFFKMTHQTAQTTRIMKSLIYEVNDPYEAKLSGILTLIEIWSGTLTLLLISSVIFLVWFKYINFIFQIIMLFLSIWAHRTSIFVVVCQNTYPIITHLINGDIIWTYWIKLTSAMIIIAWFWMCTL